MTINVKVIKNACESFGNPSEKYTKPSIQSTDSNVAVIGSRNMLKERNDYEDRL